MSDVEPAAPPSAARSDGAAERIVLAILVLMACVLAYLRFSFLPHEQAPPAPAFDLKNPLLDARLGECVEVEDTPESPVTCVTVIAPGVVLRPGKGPERIGIYDDLRRSLPYLACGLRYPERGSRCSGATDAKPEDFLLFDLNGFGMPTRLHVETFSIRAVWRRWGNRAGYVYEVQMQRHGSYSGPNVVWIADDAPVTGVLRRQYAQGRNPSQVVTFREVEGCATR